MLNLRGNGGALRADGCHPQKLSQFTDSIWLLAAAVVFLLLQLPLTGYIVDDAYIHLTFARNIAAGHGFSFNPDQPTYGVTAPLWTLFLAFLSLLFTPSGELAKLASIVFGLATIPVFRELADRCRVSPLTARWMTMVWAVNVWLVRWSASGMESSCAVLFLMLAVNSQFSGRVWRVGIFSGLAFLCRPETAGMALILIADRWWGEGRKSALKTLLGWLLAALPWLLFAWLEFGTIISNPARIKSDAGLPQLADFLLGVKRSAMILIGSNGVEIILIILGLIILRRYRGFGRDNSRFILLLAVWALFPIAVYLSRGVFISSRYLLIGVPPLIAAGYHLFESISEFRWRKMIPRLIPWISIIIIAQQLALTEFVTIPHIKTFKPTLAALSKLSALIEQETPEDAVIAVGDVGLVGFYSHRRILDLEGLVSPEVIPYRVRTNLDDFIINGRFLKAGRADYIIDKSRDPVRLEGGKLNASFIAAIPVPGALVETAEEDWYYTLYRLSRTTEKVQ